GGDCHSYQVDVCDELSRDSEKAVSGNRFVSAIQGLLERCVGRSDDGCSHPGLLRLAGNGAAVWLLSQDAQQLREAPHPPLSRGWHRALASDPGAWSASHTLRS